MGLILLLGSLTLPLVLIFVAKVIVPFYRNAVGMSAYEYLGARFGIGGRLYASGCFVCSGPCRDDQEPVGHLHGGLGIVQREAY